jgi:hypothetical protein
MTASSRAVSPGGQRRSPTPLAFAALGRASHALRHATGRSGPGRWLPHFPGLGLGATPERSGSDTDWTRGLGTGGSDAYRWRLEVEPTSAGEARCGVDRDAGWSPGADDGAVRCAVGIAAASVGEGESCRVADHGGIGGRCRPRSRFTDSRARLENALRLVVHQTASQPTPGATPVSFARPLAGDRTGFDSHSRLPVSTAPAPRRQGVRRTSSTEGIRGLTMRQRRVNG